MIKNNTTRQRFELDVEGGIAALDYKVEGKKLYLTHAGVPAAAQGKGVAAQLTRKALQWAAEKRLTVVPLCSYVETYLDLHPEYSPLLQ